MKRNTLKETVSIRIKSSTHQRLRKIAAHQGGTIMNLIDTWASSTWATIFHAELERAATSGDEATAKAFTRKFLPRPKGTR